MNKLFRGIFTFAVLIVFLVSYSLTAVGDDVVKLLFFNPSYLTNYCYGVTNNNTDTSKLLIPFVDRDFMGAYFNANGISQGTDGDYSGANGFLTGSSGQYIIMGFSQGGLRARGFYKKLMNEGSAANQSKIMGLINVATPNGGSPIATPQMSNDLVAYVYALLLVSMSTLCWVAPVLGTADDRSSEFDDQVYDKFMASLSSGQRSVFDEVRGRIPDGTASDYKGALATQTGITAVSKLLFGNDSNWFTQMLKGAMNYPGTDPSYVRTAQDLSPGSSFLNTLNNPTYVNGTEKNIKRVGLITRDGTVEDTGPGYIATTAVKGYHLAMFVYYMTQFAATAWSGWFNPYPWICLAAAAHNMGAYGLWAALPGKWSACLTGTWGNNGWHDLIVPAQGSYNGYQLNQHFPLTGYYANGGTGSYVITDGKYRFFDMDRVSHVDPAVSENALRNDVFMKTGSKGPKSVACDQLRTYMSNAYNFCKQP